MVKSRRLKKGGLIPPKLPIDAVEYTHGSSLLPSMLSVDEDNTDTNRHISIIATHQSRIRCMLSSILEKPIERFMNGAVLRIEINPQNMNIELLYPGELSEVKPEVEYYVNNIIGNETDYTPILFETINTSYGDKFDTQGKTYVFFIIRHGQGTHNVLKGLAKKSASVTGKRDTKLTPKGFNQAKNTGKILSDNNEFLNAKSLFSSDLFRTIETLVTVIKTATSMSLESGKELDGVTRNGIIVLPCAHELNYDKSGKCDGTSKQMIMGNENRSSSQQTTDYRGVPINWEYYSTFYNGSRMSPGSNRQKCRNTNFLQEAIKIVNSNILMSKANIPMTAVGGRRKKYSKKSKKNKKLTRKSKIKRKYNKNKKTTRSRKKKLRKRKRTRSRK